MVTYGKGVEARHMNAPCFVALTLETSNVLHNRNNSELNQTEETLLKIESYCKKVSRFMVHNT